MDSDPKNRRLTAERTGHWAGIVRGGLIQEKRVVLEAKRRAYVRKIGKRGWMLKAAIWRLKFKKEQHQ